MPLSITVHYTPGQITGPSVGPQGPRGDEGDDGDPGAPGTPGVDGFSGWEPADGNLIACSMADPAAASGVVAALAGYPLVARVKVPPGSPVITKAGVWLAVAGSGLTSGQNFLGVYNTAGDLLAMSADQTSAFQTAGLILPTLDNPITPDPAGEMLYVALLINGSGMPLLAAGAGASGNSNPANIGLASPPYRSSWYPSPLTALPSSVTWGGTSPAISIFLYVLA